MGDKMKNKTIIVLKKAACLSYHPSIHTQTHTLTFPPGVPVVCVRSEINIIITCTKESRRVEETGAHQHNVI